MPIPHACLVAVLASCLMLGSVPRAVAPPEPYALSVCPISGKALGAMGDPVVRLYEGREVRFCCAECPVKFEADRAAGWKKVEDLVIREQTPYFPVTCPVSGHPLTRDGGDIGVNRVYGTRLIRFCSAECAAKFDADPSACLAELDKRITADQLKEYPLQSCPVSDEKLGSMGAPVDLVVGNRLVRLCCKGCTRDLLKNPSPALAALDRAWKKACPERFSSPPKPGK
jgi:YHS domain-containing protein